MWGISCKILSVPHNTLMDMNNVTNAFCKFLLLFFKNHHKRVSLGSCGHIENGGNHEVSVGPKGETFVIMK